MGVLVKLAALVACVTFYGCGHNVYMAGRTNGLTGSTVVRGGGGGGDLIIALGPRTYIGRWVYAETGGGTGLGSDTTFAGSQTATTNATFVALPAGSNGTLIASAPDGMQLRCTFNYSELSDAGSGVCQDSSGDVYDLQIH